MADAPNGPASGQTEIDKVQAGQATPRHHASLGLRIAGRIAAIFLLFGIAQFFLIQRITRGQFQDIERTNLLDRTRLALSSLTREGKHLEGITATNAAWDDTYNYMAKPDPSYLKTTYGGDWPKTYAIDFVAMVATDGRRVWNSEGYPSFPRSGPTVFLAEHFDQNDPYVFPHGNQLKQADSFTGLVGSEQGVWMYCVYPITDNNATKTPPGALVFGRLIDKALLSSYAFGQGDELSFIPLGTVVPLRPSGDYPVAREFPIFKGGGTTIQAGEGSLVSLTPISDSANKPFATLRLSIPSAIQRLGERFVWLTSSFLFIIAIVTLVFILIAIRLSVIRPIALLAASFSTPTDERDVILRICAQRDDEIGTLAEQAGALMVKVEEQNAELESQANTDRLTGLPNRRSFDSHLNREFRRLQRNHRGNQKNGQIAVVIVDVDHFKLFNDTNGHLAGDACLKIIAESIRSCIMRAGDLACRFGGEEFILILPDTDEAGALVVSELVRAAIERIAFPHPSSPISSVVTVSVGAAAKDVVEGFDIDALIEEADRALYAAKRAGRNRVAGSTALT